MTVDTASESLGDDQLLSEMSSIPKQANRPVVRLSNTSSGLKTENTKSHDYFR